ncbi:MAG: phosphatase PAP2 family protein [Bacteroidetes bacterium]|nr:phosphatase PAP2 family protein [Bacteroidota bacterium]
MNAFIQQIWQWLNAWDTALFLQINVTLTNPLFDRILPIWRNANTWVPLYLFLIVFSVVNFKKQSFFWILGAVMTLVLTDQISSSFFKPFFERPRPCNDPILMSHVRLLLDHCSGGYSFTSSHATNHFGFAVYVFMTLRKVFHKWSYLFLIWAVTVSYAQVYVGVHYPLDILSGALIGSSIGYASSQIFVRQSGPIILE